MKNNSIHINCPILLYSNFSDNIAIAKEETVHADKFRRDIETLISEGYTIVSLLDILDAKKCNSFLPERSVCIALFGGYEGQYRYAFPVLAELNVHANAFVATDLVGKAEYPGVSPFIPHFGWQEAAEMQKSGLVDIYAMWHPFDENKPVEPEVINKIELIKRHVPNSTPEAAFCMNMDNNTEEKQIALDKAGIELIISYYWSFRPENYNEGRLPYISVNQESNILDVIEHFNARINAQSNLNMELESIDSLVFDWKPKVGGAILSIDKTPRIKNLLRSAIPLSIIGATRRDREDLIVLNNYIEVVFRPWYHFFDYDNHMYLNWPELSCCRLTKDYIRTAKANVADIVLYGLEAGYYTDVWADQYYIPDKPGYKRQHLSHNILIYGYDSEINVFRAMTYTKSEHYQPFELKPDDLLRACSSEYFNAVQLIKNNPDCQVTYDIRVLIEKLKRYISSGYEFANNTKCSRYDSNQLVNFDACVHFPKYVADIAEKEHKIYIVCFYGYTEHKMCMGWRLEYIAKREGFEDGFFSEYREYAEKTSDRIMKLGMKYNITHNESIVPKIIKLMEELNANEAEAVKAMLKRIDGL